MDMNSHVNCSVECVFIKVWSVLLSLESMYLAHGISSTIDSIDSVGNCITGRYYARCISDRMFFVNYTRTPLARSAHL